MEHTLSFQAIDEGAVDLIDLYSTDAKIKKSSCECSRTITIIFRFIRRCGWRAVLHREASAPVAALVGLQGAISEEAMLDMNAQADIQNMSFDKIAAQFLGSEAPRRSP